GVRNKGKGKPGEKLVYLVDVATGEVKTTLEDAGGQYLAFSPDNKTLAIGSSDGQIGTLALWDVATGAKRFQSPAGTSIGFLAFFPDGRTLLISRVDGLGFTTFTMDTATGKEKPLTDVTPVLHPFCRGGAKCLSQDGKLLAAAGFPNVISVWDLAA